MIYLILKILGFILAALTIGWWLGASWYRLRLSRASAQHLQLCSELEAASQSQQELLLARERNLLDETHRRRDLESRLEEQTQARVIAEQRSSALEVSLDRETAAVKALDTELRNLREAHQKALARAKESAKESAKVSAKESAMVSAKESAGETQWHDGQLTGLSVERDRLQQEKLKLGHRVGDLEAELAQVRLRNESSETERLDLRIRLEAATQERDEIMRRLRTLEETSRSRAVQVAPQPAMHVTAPLAQRFTVASGQAAEIHEQPPASVDDLTQISGIGRKLEKQLNALGIYQLMQLASLSPEQICWVDEKLSFRGRIHREDWVGQAIAMVGPHLSSSGDQT